MKTVTLFKTVILLAGLAALMLCTGCPTTVVSGQSQPINSGSDDCTGELQNGLAVEVEVQVLADGTFYAEEVEINPDAEDNEDGDDGDEDGENEDDDTDEDEDDGDDDTDEDEDNGDDDTDEGEDDGDDYELEGTISELTETSFVVNGVLITFDQNTEIEDEACEDDDEDDDNDNNENDDEDDTDEDNDDTDEDDEGDND